MTPQNSFRGLLKSNARIVPFRRNLKSTFAVLFVSLAMAVAVLASMSFVTKWGTEGVGDGQFETPTGVAVDASGHVYTVDGGQRGQKFNNNGVFQFSFASPGSQPGQLDAPNGIAVDSAGNIYVSENGDPVLRVSKFNSSGTFLS